MMVSAIQHNEGKGEERTMKKVGMTRLCLDGADAGLGVGDLDAENLGPDGEEEREGGGELVSSRFAYRGRCHKSSSLRRRHPIHDAAGRLPSTRRILLGSLLLLLAQR